VSSSLEASWQPLADQAGKITVGQALLPSVTLLVRFVDNLLTFNTSLKFTH
jgi:hypothetical protein